MKAAFHVLLLVTAALTLVYGVERVSNWGSYRANKWTHPPGGYPHPITEVLVSAGVFYGIVVWGFYLLTGRLSDLLFRAFSGKHTRNVIAAMAMIAAVSMLAGFRFVLDNPHFYVIMDYVIVAALYTLAGLGLILAHKSVKFIGNSTRRAGWMLAIGIFAVLLSYLILEFMYGLSKI